MNRLKPRAAAAAGMTLLMGLLLAGCANSAPAAMERGEQDANGTSDLIAVSSEELDAPSAWPWQRTELIDDTHIRVWFERVPDPTCVRYDVLTQEGSDVVAVTIVKGVLQDCEDNDVSSEAEVAVLDSIVVETSDPIRERRIVDGSASPAPGTATEPESEADEGGQTIEDLED